MKKPTAVSFLTTLIGIYRKLISPWLGTRCRFVPSCSDYANQAVQQHGAAKGSVMAVKRVCRCHPWGGDGYDPVPEKSPQRKTDSRQSERRHTTTAKPTQYLSRTNG